MGKVVLSIYLVVFCMEVWQSCLMERAHVES